MRSSNRGESSRGMSQNGMDSPPPYSPSENGSVVSSVVGPIRTPNVQLTPTTAGNQRSSTAAAKTRAYRRTEILTTLQFALSCAMLLFGIATQSLSGLIARDMESCESGTGIWVGVIGMSTGALGYVLLTLGKEKHKFACFAHLAVSVLSAFAFGTVIFSSFSCIAIGAYPAVIAPNNGYYPGYPRGSASALLAFQVFMVPTAGGALLITVILLIAEIRVWIGKEEKRTTVCYLNGQSSGGQGGVQALTVPTGSQILLVPNGSTFHDVSLNPAVEN